MPAQDFANQLIIDVEGTALPPDMATLLLQAVVDDSRTVPDLFALRFRDPDHAVLEKCGFAIGKKVTLKVANSEDNAPVPMLVGEVTALEVEFDGAGTITVVRGLDATHRLMRGRRVAAYQQMTVSDVVKRVAGDAKIDMGEIESTKTVYEQISQGNLTDWEFLRTLSGDVGAELQVVEGKLRFTRPKKAGEAPPTNKKATEDPLVLELGRNITRLRATVTSAEQVPDVQVRSWDHTAKRAVVGRATAATTSAEVGAKPAELASTFQARTMVAADTPYLTQTEVDEAAEALAEQVAGGFAELEAVMRGNPKVRAGTAVALAGVGVPFDGKYTVSATRHVWAPETGYTTWVTVAGGQDRTLLGLVEGGRGGDRRMDGVVVGQVSDNRDPEKSGRVRLTFPWLSDDFVSPWARTMQLGAGNNRGALIVPEVGDEVMVAFEHGSFQRPYVVGGLYNGIDKPDPGDTPLVDESSGAIDRRAFVSRTGHRLEMLEASSGKQMIRMRTGDGKLFLELDQQQTLITIQSDGTATITARNGVTVDAGTGTLALTGQDIEMTAKNGVKIDGSTVKVTSKSSLDVEGAAVKVNGSATTDLKGGAMLTVQAALVKIN